MRYAKDCSCSTTTGRSSWSTTRRGVCSTCPTTSSVAGWTASASLPDWSRPPRARTAAPDDIYLAGERALVVSSAPASWRGREVGAVVTLRDHTELRSVTGELDVVRGLTESLRAQTHEAANRLHTVVSLIEMGRPEQAIAFATEELQRGPAPHRPRGRRRGRSDRRGTAAGQVGRGGRARNRPRPSRASSPTATCPLATWSPCSATWSTTPSTRSPATRCAGSWSG